jgi:hypothetical protein
MVAPSAASDHARLLLVAGLDSLPIDVTPIGGRRGFDASAPLQDYAATDGTFVVQAEELDRLELHLNTTKGRRFDGYMRTPSGLAALPAGSQLDATGVFAWQTGAGFVGSYDFVFVELSGGLAVERVDVRIVLNPKRSDRVGPQAVIDAPAARASDGAPIVVPAGGFAVTGWAADFSSAVDAGVDVVHVWAYRVDGGGSTDPVFVGPALVNSSRPDVGALCGTLFSKTGYGVVVNTLPPGMYDIAVFAYSTVTHRFAPAQIVRVIVK